MSLLSITLQYVVFTCQLIEKKIGFLFIYAATHNVANKLLYYYYFDIGMNVCFVECITAIY